MTAHSRLVIVADENIPYVQELFGPYGQVISLPGNEIQQATLKHADVLLTRTVTRVNETLLQNTSVKFVGTATAGYDHIDAEALQNLGISWAYAEGANARAVAEYVLCCVAYLRSQNFLCDESVRAAVVGAGKVGSCVAQLLRAVGFEVLFYDPPRAAREPGFSSASWEEIQSAQLFCIHTPLTTDGPFPTYHLFDAACFQNLSASQAIVLNAGRGAVLDNEAAVHAPDNVFFCLDVWENEPHIHQALLQRVMIGTPHIAGYTQKAKWETVYAVYHAFLKHFHLQDAKNIASLANFEKQTRSIAISDCARWESVLLKVYNPAIETQRLRTENFSTLRNNYSFRDEFSQILLQPSPIGTQAVQLRSLGFRIN